MNVEKKSEGYSEYKKTLDTSSPWEEVDDEKRKHLNGEIRDERYKSEVLYWAIDLSQTVWLPRNHFRCGSGIQADGSGAQQWGNKGTEAQNHGSWVHASLSTVESD